MSLPGRSPGTGASNLNVSPRLTENASTFTSASFARGSRLGDVGEDDRLGRISGGYESFHGCCLPGGACGHFTG